MLPKLFQNVTTFNNWNTEENVMVLVKNIPTCDDMSTTDVTVDFEEAVKK